MDGNIQDLFELYSVSPLTDGGYGSQSIMLNHNIKNTTKTSLEHILGKKLEKTFVTWSARAYLKNTFY